MAAILNVYWFNGGGIVRVLDPYDGIKYYIKGIDKMSNADDDADDIADWGNSFPKAAGDALFGMTE